ncbi:MAG: hypothetical protein JKY65_29360 [Planctomycetes bacterium]|nr:hypothetical protein [Planctomycetota bacterium]
MVRHTPNPTVDADARSELSKTSRLDVGALLGRATQLLSPPRKSPEKNECFRLASFDAAGAFVGEDTQTHDHNGNRIRNGKHRLFFDLFDRLVRVERVSDGTTVGRYAYDAAGRHNLQVQRANAASAYKDLRDLGVFK